MLHLYNRYKRFELALVSHWMFRNRRWERAAESYTQLIDIYPDAPQYYRCLGDAYFRLGRWQDAEAAYHSAVRRGSTELLTFLHLGKVLARQGRWEEAVEAFRKSTSLDADSFESQHQLGDALCQVGHFADALPVYEKALALSPENASCWQNMGSALSKLARWEQAEAACRKAIQLDSTLPLPFLHLGEALANQNRAEEAAESFRTSIGLDAENPWPHHHLGDALSNLGHLEDAVTAYQHALSLYPDNRSSLRNLGDTLSRLERWNEAESAYLGARAIAADDPMLTEALGSVWLKLQRWEQAASALEECVARNPDNIELRRNLGIAVFKFEAQKAYRKAHTDSPWDGQCNEDDDVAPPPSEWSAGHFGQRVVEVERWVESLVPGSDRCAIESTDRADGVVESARLLFILDNDFGELTTLMYLLLGQQWANNIMLLMPESLYKTNSQAFPGRTFCFQSIDGVEQVVDSFHPDIVFLCSGYLYAMHGLLSLTELERLVEFLGKRGCKIVTADPFLGLLSRQPIPALISVDLPDAAELALPAYVFEHLAYVKAEQDDLLIEKLSGAERILRQHLHLYPAHAVPGIDEACEIDAREMAFFNPSLVCNLALKPETGTKPHWIFILSTTDLETQMMFEAVRGFTDIVARLLKQAIAMGRRPIFIGPEKFICELAREMRGQEGVELLSFCSFTRIAALLLTAEYAFYWNSVSHSILLRSFNGLPVILFDRGHLVRNIEAIYERVVKWYYQGVQPIYMDHDQTLSLDGLKAATAGFRQAAECMDRGFRRAHQPKHLIAQILGAT